MSSLNYQVKGATADIKSLQALRLLSTNFFKKPQKTSALFGGQHRSTHQSRGMEFEEVRLYQAGDDVRTIDWRVTARTRKPHTKCFQEEKEKPIITVVDQRASMFFGSAYCFKSVYVSELCALINWACLDMGDRSGGMIIGENTTEFHRPSRTRVAMNRWLQRLCHYNHALTALTLSKRISNDTNMTLTETLKQLKNSITPGADLFILSDFHDIDPDCEPLLYELTKSHQLTFYWCYDPLEVKPPILDQATFSNGSDEAVLSINSTIQNVIFQQFNDRKKYMNQLCRQLKIKLISVSTHTPLTESAFAAPSL